MTAKPRKRAIAKAQKKLLNHYNLKGKKEIQIAKNVIDLLLKAFVRMCGNLREERKNDSRT